jgi:glutamyl-tRNA synthetase
MNKIVTRFAPSPTGFMHIGGVRTALFAWLWAKKNKGTFILRIEDTDKEREVAGSIEHIQESLKWLGIDWDYGPDKPGPFGSCIQSERLETYKKVAQVLIDKGLAYPDPYTKEEVEAFHKQADDSKKPFLFRDHRPKTFDMWDGNKPLRFKVPNIKRYKWHDIVRGNLEAGEEALDDFIIIKSDGYPTYNFAHIIDDNAMDVTHVLRGDEFISSTPKFLSLYEALDIPVPQFATLPPILRDDRTKKLGKRDGAKDMLEYRSEGYLPEAFLNYLVLIGWNPGDDREVMSLPEIITSFDLSKVQKGGAVFDEEKLKWMNKQYMSKLSNDEYLAQIKTFFKNDQGSMINDASESKSKDKEKKEIDNRNRSEANQESEAAFGARLARQRGIFQQENIRADEPLDSRSLNEEILKRSLPVIRDRAHTFGDVAMMFKGEGELSFVLDMPTYDAKKLSWKGDTAATTSLHLEKIIELLTHLKYFSVEEIKKTVWPYALEKGKGNVLWPMRFALTGRDKSPDPFISASILGKEESLKRLKTAIASLKILC